VKIILTLNPMLSSAKAARETRRGKMLFSRAEGESNAIVLPGCMAGGKMPASEEDMLMLLMFDIACIGGSIAGETASRGIAIVWFVVVVVEGYMGRSRRRSDLWWYTDSLTSIRVTMKCEQKSLPTPGKK
jgi:hypothetical protein